MLSRAIGGITAPCLTIERSRGWSQRPPGGAHGLSPRYWVDRKVALVGRLALKLAVHHRSPRLLNRWCPDCTRVLHEVVAVRGLGLEGCLWLVHGRPRQHLRLLDWGPRIVLRVARLAQCSLAAGLEDAGQGPVRCTRLQGMGDEVARIARPSLELDILPRLLLVSDWRHPRLNRMPDIVRRLGGDGRCLPGQVALLLKHNTGQPCCNAGTAGTGSECWQSARHRMCKHKMQQLFPASKMATEM